MAGWRPDIEPGDAPLYERLTAALIRDVTSGKLRPGEKIPPQRDLAHRLKIGIGTVTRAYAEATRRGVLRAQVGSGSFVSEAPAPSGPLRPSRTGLVDMTRNTVPLDAAAAHLSEALARLRRRPDLLSHLDYSPPGGMDSHRRAGAVWLERLAGMGPVDPERIICTGGVQQAMSLVLTSLCRPGDTVMCEAVTFFGFKALAKLSDLKLQGLAMDREGLLPEALDRAAAGGARVLYTMPSLQNPTARVMGPQRRAEIVRVARARDLWIVEDDSYAIFTPPGVTPLAALAPERVFHLGGLSKALAQGLRTGFLTLPDRVEREAFSSRIHALYYSPSGFGTLIGTQWIEDGTAWEIVAAVRAEMGLRLAAARRILGGLMEDPPLSASPHVWGPFSELQAERIAAGALRGGVELTPPSAPIVDASLASGLRLCLGGAADLASLEQGLQAIRSAVAAAPDDRARGLV